MTTKQYFVAGDWGTSNLRLYLCQFSDDGAMIIDTKYGLGISQINGDFEDRLFNLADPWFAEYGAMPVLLSGMVGSNIGWKEVPYLHCPLSVSDIANGRLQFVARGIEVSILGGLRTLNPLSNPDVMRGEELQMLGWMKLKNEPIDQQLFALPGTHNKWTLVEQNKLSNFMTAFTGELFALLRDHSILIRKQTTFNFNQAAFLSGVEAQTHNRDARLIHSLFSIRSRQVVGEMPENDALSYMSGMIIAADVFGALRCFGEQESVVVIGDNSLADHYSLVLEKAQIRCRRCDPAQIAIAGFETIYRAIYA